LETYGKLFSIKNILQKLIFYFKPGCRIYERIFGWNGSSVDLEIKDMIWELLEAANPYHMEILTA